MKRTIGWIVTLILLGSFLSIPTFALAETTDPNTIDLNAGGMDVNDNSSFDVGNILRADGQDTDKYINTEKPVITFILEVINFITLIIGSIAMILIILGGLLMIASEGDENRLQRGKGIVLAAIIGLVISMASYLIVTFVQSIFY